MCTKRELQCFKQDMRELVAKQAGLLFLAWMLIVRGQLKTTEKMTEYSLSTTPSPLPHLTMTLTFACRFPGDLDLTLTQCEVLLERNESSAVWSVRCVLCLPCRTPEESNFSTPPSAKLEKRMSDEKSMTSVYINFSKTRRSCSTTLNMTLCCVTPSSSYPLTSLGRGGRFFSCGVTFNSSKVFVRRTAIVVAFDNSLRHNHRPRRQVEATTHAPADEPTETPYETEYTNVLTIVIGISIFVVCSVLLIVAFYLVWKDRQAKRVLARRREAIRAKAAEASAQLREEMVADLLYQSKNRGKGLDDLSLSSSAISTKSVKGSSHKTLSVSFSSAVDEIMAENRASRSGGSRYSSTKRSRKPTAYTNELQQGYRRTAADAAQEHRRKQTQGNQGPSVTAMVQHGPLSDDYSEGPKIVIHVPVPYEPHGSQGGRRSSKVYKKKRHESKESAEEEEEEEPEKEKRPRKISDSKSKVSSEAQLSVVTGFSIVNSDTSDAWEVSSNVSSERGSPQSSVVSDKEDDD